MLTWHEYTGNIHMHTVHSDGTGTFEHLTEAAHGAGLDFIIVTDHNVMIRPEEGYHDGLLVLVGVEVNDQTLDPPGNHLLCLDVSENLVALARDPQTLIDAVHDQGGMAFLAHPIERNSRLMSGSYRWHNWEVNRYQGVELWNYMSEFRGYATSWPVALLLTYLPALFSTGPWPEMLEKWDSLTQVRPVVAIGGSDVHARTYRLGPLRRVVFPYRHCFLAVNTHILSSTPLVGDLNHDRETVYAALRAGHCWIGYDLIGNTAGFRFTATQGAQKVIMGDSLGTTGVVQFDVRVPAPADIRLLCNGQVVCRERGRTLSFAAQQSGVYRVEARRQAWFKPRGWIFSNPIYVMGGG